MKLYNKTLMEIEYKVNLSQVGACASCDSAQFRETKQYANEAVATHRAISSEARNAIAALLKRIDTYDAMVERANQDVMKITAEDLK